MNLPNVRTRGGGNLQMRTLLLIFAWKGPKYADARGPRIYSFLWTSFMDGPLYFAQRMQLTRTCRHVVYTPSQYIQLETRLVATELKGNTYVNCYVLTKRDY